MNRQERRKLQRQGLTVPKDPSINVKLSELSGRVMTPSMTAAMEHEINQQCIAADKRYSIDIDTVVLWTLHKKIWLWPQAPP